ncbi:MAG: penicillin acylase family protein [Candidatus Aminicenantes bacterium]|nr:MAG: penicillin acylase family protein [Candidatus Aminicenantes bacterium]
MKLLKKILIGLVAVIILAIIAGYIYIRHLATKAIPDYNQNVKLENIKEPITVYRDQYAIPHIYAKNEQDLYRAVGYVMAQDRLWQMDLLRRVTTGRLAEIFGETMLKTDLLMRALRITEKSQLLLSKTDPEIIKCAQAFADGVNQYIHRNKNKLPPEFSILRYEPEPWEVIHSMNLIGYMAWDLTEPWKAEFLLYELSKKVTPDKFKEMIPNLSLHETDIFPGFYLGNPGLELRASLLSETGKLANLGLAIFSGSNNWAVSNKKSTTGKPILANDMHLGLFTPGIWYPMHQVVENQLDVTGVVLPGQPFIIAGHNLDIAWGMTNVMVDDMDFYRETINPENSNQYRFKHQWQEINTRTETFKTREGNTIKKELKFTHRGPIISGFKNLENEVISMRWIGNEYSNEMRTVYLLNRAKNWEDFRDAVKTFIAVSQNIVYADVKGNIGLQIAAGVPIREGNGIDVVPGDTDKYDWKGIVPFEHLPYSFNPESGHVSSANNKTVNDNYPFYISHWFFLPDRINRIRQLLEKNEKLSIEDFKKMQGDFKSKHVQRYLEDIVKIIQQMKDLNALEKQALHLLSHWDGVLSKESTAATVFENLYMVMVKNLVKDELGEELYREYLGNKNLIRSLVANTWKNKNSQWCDDINTEARETFVQWIQKSFKETIQKLQSELGNNPGNWQWGKIHQLMLKHPLGSVKLLNTLFDFNRGPFAVGGSFHTVCPYSYSFGNPFVSDHGASQRHIYSPGNWDESLAVIPTGISGIPASPYYCDQTRLYIENKYHSDYVSKELVINNARYTMVISRE